MGRFMDTRKATAAWFAVVRAFRTCESRYEQMLERFDLSTAQYEVLNIVHELGGSAQPARIAERLLVTRGNVTGLLSRLEAAGWVRVTQHPTDGRSRCVELTPRAERVVQDARRAAARFIEQQCAPFTAAELDATRSIMERMRAHLETMDVARITAASQGTRPSRASGLR
jgi:DNA-binding MarR family transcriptional regulator